MGAKSTRCLQVVPALLALVATALVVPGTASGSAPGMAPAQTWTSTADSAAAFPTGIQQLGTANQGSLQLDFDVTAAAAPINGVVGYADTSTPVTDYADFAIAFRFSNAGYFDARDGAGYARTTTLSYVAGRTYHAVVQHNLFEDCDGDAEVISNKSSDNIYRYNTFRSNRGSLVLRHGDRNRVEGNYFLSNTGRFRMYGDKHTVLGNYFSGNNGGLTSVLATFVIGSGDTAADDEAASTSFYASMNIDLDGQPRVEPKDTGADEYSTATIGRHPLLPADVGPDGTENWARVSVLQASVAWPEGARVRPACRRG